MRLNQEQIALVQSVKRMVKGCKFASFTYTSKGDGKVARYTLLVGQNYRELVNKSIVELTNLQAIEGVDTSTFELAKMELLRSMTETKETGKNRAYTKAGMYAHLGNGLKLSLNDFTFEIGGTIVSYLEIAPPVTPKKPVNSAPKTIAKNLIRKLLPIGKFITLALDTGNLHSARMNGETFEMA